ncbi:uncharacterized protein [Gossypium hirsutum]|uniref:Uncharacterized protein n=1 Tax=Gossypium hirsutum TaxID=3635 RepID=A0A1U8MWI7_GOSHI|nr:uncharacterized protein LOC107942067 [Gossypium hirsutum]
MVVTEHKHYVRYEDGLRGSLRVLIAPQREIDFSTMVEKAKITEEVKRTERQNRDKERGKNKRDSEPLSSAMRPKKKVRYGGPIRVGAPIAPTRITLCGHYGRRHLGECWRTTKACLRCGSTVLHVRECSLRADQVQAMGSGTEQPPRVVQQPSRGCGQAKDGSTHSYVACSVSKNLGIPVESTSSEVTMLSPLGQSVRVSKLYRDVPLEVQGMVFLGDLMELPFEELGMDCLVKHRASLTCATKSILRTEWGNEVIMIGERRNYLANVISTLVAKKLVCKGCEAYLAYVSVFASGDSTVKDIRTMRGFPDVFLEELLGLPLNWEVEFEIELLPSTSSVPITPYRMARKELTDLKAQIQELRLSISYLHVCCSQLRYRYGNGSE